MIHEVLVSQGSFSKVSQQRYTTPYGRRQKQVMNIISLESAASLLSLFFISIFGKNRES